MKRAEIYDRYVKDDSYREYVISYKRGIFYNHIYMALDASTKFCIVGINADCKNNRNLLYNTCKIENTENDRIRVRMYIQFDNYYDDIPVLGVDLLYHDLWKIACEYAVLSGWQYTDIDGFIIDMSSSNFSNILDIRSMFNTEIAFGKNGGHKKLACIFPKDADKRLRPICADEAFRGNIIINFKKIVNSIDFSELASANGMFDRCTLPKNLDMRGIKFPKLVSAGKMFRGCKSIERIETDESCFGAVENIPMMFSECCNLKSVNIKMFGERSNKNRVIVANNLFSKCSELENINVELLLRQLDSKGFVAGIFEESCNIKWYSREKNFIVDMSDMTDAGDFGDYRLHYQGVLNNTESKYIDLRGLKAKVYDGCIIPFTVGLSSERTVVERLPYVLVIDEGQYNMYFRGIKGVTVLDTSGVSIETILMKLKLFKWSSKDRIIVIDKAYKSKTKRNRAKATV